MIRRVYNDKGGKVAENDKFSIYVYKHPTESGQERWHAHFVRRSDGTDAKISLWDFSLMRATSFDRNTVKAFIEWTYINRHFLRRKWVQNVLRPFLKSLGKWRSK
jgi:hypothetical protein